MNNSSLASLTHIELVKLRAERQEAMIRARVTRDAFRRTTSISGSDRATQAYRAYEQAEAAFEAVISEQRNRNFATA